MQTPSYPATPSAIETPEQGPSLILGLIGGTIGMALSAVLWGAITYFTNYQASLMAIGVGFLVGFGTKLLGRGASVLLGLAAAILSLLGCLLGNLFFYCGIIAREYAMGFVDVLIGVMVDPALLIDLFKAGFQAMDILFYGLAIYIGFVVAAGKTRKPVSQPA